MDRSESPLAAEMPRLHLLMRLGFRIEQVVMPGGAARVGWKRVANVASTGADLVAYSWLRSAPEATFARRVAVSVADQGLWEALVPDGAMSAVGLGMPLALESTDRFGSLGLVVPAASVGASMAGRLVRGRSLRPNGLPLLVAVALGGLGWSVTRSRRLAREREAHAVHLEAERSQAFLAGQNSVAMGADSIVDDLQALVPLVGEHTGRRAIEQISAGWKSSLAEQSSASAVYLGLALARWSHRHNLHPDLQSRVDFSIQAGDGTALLTGSQALALARILDGLGLSGKIAVRVLERVDERLPGRTLAITLDDRRVDVPADPAASIRRFDPSAAVLASGVVWALAPTQRANEHSSLIGQAPFSIAFGAAAWWVARRTGRLPAETAAWDAIRVALGVGTVSGLVATITQRVPFGPNGMQNLPFSTSAFPGILLLGIHGHRLSPARLRAATAALAANLLAGYLLLPRPRQPFAVLMEQWWLWTVWTTAARVGKRLDDEATRLGARLAEGDDEVVTAAYNSGRKFVVELVAHAVAELHQSIGSEMDQGSPDADYLRERLRQLQLRVEALGAI